MNDWRDSRDPDLTELCVALMCLSPKTVGPIKYFSHPPCRSKGILIGRDNGEETNPRLLNKLDVTFINYEKVYSLHYTWLGCENDLVSFTFCLVCVTQNDASQNCFHQNLESFRNISIDPILGLFFLNPLFLNPTWFTLTRHDISLTGVTVLSFST